MKGVRSTVGRLQDRTGAMPVTGEDGTPHDMVPGMESKNREMDVIAIVFTCARDVEERNRR